MKLQVEMKEYNDLTSLNAPKTLRPISRSKAIWKRKKNKNKNSMVSHGYPIDVSIT